VTGALLKGRIAVVTGGAQGIGRSVARRFIREGCLVAILDVAEARGRDAAAELGDGCTFQRCNVAIESDVEEALTGTAATLGPIDVLVNNAGVDSHSDPATMTERDWDELMGVNLKAAWLCAKHVLPGMRERKRGSIVNIASIHAVVTVAGMFPYAAAKSGLAGLTRSLALECAGDGVRVNTLCPGFVSTPPVEQWLASQPDAAAAERKVRAAHPLGRIGKPDEIAAAVTFLASDEASFITAATLMADGGLSARMAV
jgi:NAD(P)-dependent dehydrogenase (short-subunit alcohol dehydrogenase family)